jgi:hypothetical protein
MYKYSSSNWNCNGSLGKTKIEIIEINEIVFN